MVFFNYFDQKVRAAILLFKSLEGIVKPPLESNFR